MPAAAGLSGTMLAPKPGATTLAALKTSPLKALRPGVGDGDTDARADGDGTADLLLDGEIDGEGVREAEAPTDKDGVGETDGDAELLEEGGGDAPTLGVEVGLAGAEGVAVGYGVTPGRRPPELRLPQASVLPVLECGE